MDNIKSHLKHLRKWYRVRKCRSCECFQAALTQFEIDGGDEAKKMFKDLLAPKATMHGCLGCNPCKPAEIFSSYIKNKRRLSKRKKS